MRVCSQSLGFDVLHQGQQEEAHDEWRPHEGVRQVLRRDRWNVEAAHGQNVFGQEHGDGIEGSVQCNAWPHRAGGERQPSQQEARHARIEGWDRAEVNHPEQDRTKQHAEGFAVAASQPKQKDPA